MINWFGIALMSVAALASWRMSRAISVALWASFAASGAYELSAELCREAWIRGSFEHLRLVSLVVGSAGVWELVRRAPVVGHRLGAWKRWQTPPGGWTCFARVDLLALACVASCAVDCVAYFGFYHGLAWSLPYVQSAGCGAMIGLCVWPRKEGAT